MESKAKKIFDIFENKIPEYYESDTIRMSQVQMAMDIAAFLDNKESRRIMFIEAPVGTGKSLGSLIPSLIKANKGRTSRVVYATATINLQGQLMNSEVPLLKKLYLVKQPILAKGKTHYYCHKEFNQRKNQFSTKEEETFTNFFRNAETGQRNEFEDKYTQNFTDSKWTKVAINKNVSKKDCERCDFSKSCPSNVHRNSFMSILNDLVITNHDQLIRSFLNIKAEPRQSPLIPIDPGIIIIDEAHHFLENFLNQLEESITLSKLKGLKRSISNKHKNRYDQLIDSMGRVINDKTILIDGSLQGRYKITEDLYAILSELNVLVNDSLVEESTRGISRYSNSYSDDSSDLDKISSLLKNILDENYVKWINYEEKKFSMISESFPSYFRNCIDFLAKSNKIIVMLGTLTMNGDFDSLINQWRLRINEVITKKLETPFDYQNQAIVYVPENMVRPNSSNYLELSVKEIQKLISLTGGRSLILTTSKEHMNNFSEALPNFLKEGKINLFVQEQSGVESLTKKFKVDETSVLIGSGSFFSGFSVPGKSLISVVLTKLPFPVPDDPFLELIGQGYEDEFFDMISFPYMINKLNQAAGRLIRDITDFGVFTIIDPRIFTQKYGIKVQEDLKSQGYKITRSFEEIAAFIDKKFKYGAEARYQLYEREEIDVKDVLWEKPIIKKIAKIEKKVDKTSNEVTEIQKKLAKEICKQYKIKPPSNRRTSDSLYKFLIESFYYNWEDTAIIENNFPFSNENEKQRLLKIKGSNRKPVTLPKCSEFGCDGECQEDVKLEISEYFKINYNAEDIKFNNSPSRPYCSVCVEPLKIIAQYFNQTK